MDLRSFNLIPTRYRRGLAISFFAAFVQLSTARSQELPEPPTYGVRIATDGILAYNAIPVGTAVRIDVNENGHYVARPGNFVCEKPTGQESTTPEGTSAEYVYANAEFKKKIAQGFTASASGAFGSFGGSASAAGYASNLLQTNTTSFLFVGKCEATRTVSSTTLQYSPQTLAGLTDQNPTFEQIYDKIGDGAVIDCHTIGSLLLDIDFSSLLEETHREISGSLQMNYVQFFSGSVSAFQSLSQKEKKEKVHIRAESSGVSMPSNFPNMNPSDKAISGLDALLQSAVQILTQQTSASTSVTAVTLRDPSHIGGYPAQNTWIVNYNKVRDLRLRSISAKRALSSMKFVVENAQGAGIVFAAPNFDDCDHALETTQQAIDALFGTHLADNVAFDSSFQKAQQEINAFYNTVQQLRAKPLSITLRANSGFEGRANKFHDVAGHTQALECRFQPTLSLNNLGAPDVSQFAGSLHIDGGVAPEPQVAQNGSSPAYQPMAATNFDCNKLLQPFGKLRLQGTQLKGTSTGEWQPIVFPSKPIEDYAGLTKPSDANAPLQLTISAEKKSHQDSDGVKRKYVYIYPSGRLTLEFTGTTTFGDLEQVFR
jgi:hypothetical protein